MSNESLIKRWKSVLESPLCPAEDYSNRNVNTIVRVLENQYLFNKPFREN